MAELQHVAGLRELQQALAQLPIRVARNALRGAVNAGATVIRREAVQRAPVRTGKMRRAIYQKHAPEKSGLMQATYLVGVRSGKAERAVTKRVRRGGKVLTVTLDRDAYYWRFLEFGTSKMAARPFLRPAFEVKKYDAVARIKEYLATRIEVEAGAL